MRQNLKLGSDPEIARKVADNLQRKCGKIVFCDGQFWHFDKTQWDVVSKIDIEREILRWDGEKYGSGEETKHIRLTGQRIDSIVRCLVIPLRQDDFFKSSPIGINCENGFIEFNPDTQEPHLCLHNADQRQRHTVRGRWSEKQNLVPKGRLPDDKLITKLLRGSTKDDPAQEYIIDLLSEVAGVVALGGGTRHSSPKAVVLLGRTAENGKSQILDMLRGLVSPSAVVSLSPSKFGDERQIVRLSGKVLNASDELGNARAITSDVFKAIVTGEPISGRDVYAKAVEFRSQAQHVFACNQLPSFQGGMGRDVQRRLLPVEFKRTIPKKERVLRIGARISEEEGDILLAWAIEGAKRFLKRGCFPELECSDELLKQWAIGSDYVLAWISDRVTKVECGDTSNENDGDRVASGKAWEDFHIWAKDEGIKVEGLSRQNFKQRVEAAGFEYKHSGAFRGFLGMRLDPDPKTEKVECRLEEGKSKPIKQLRAVA